MNDLNLTIIHLLHNIKVNKSIILSDNSAERLNLAIVEPDFHDKINALTMLQNQAYVHIDDNGYMGLTQKGGAFWENTLLIDWQFYFEYGSWFIGDKEYTFFYATKQETVKLAMKHSKGLFDDCIIQTAQNWQPIYWKEAFDGFYIQKELNSELLPYFADVLPKYCKNHKH